MLLETYKRALQDLGSASSEAIENENYLIVHNSEWATSCATVFTRSHKKILEITDNKVFLISPFKSLILKSLEGKYDHKEIIPVLRAFDTFYGKSSIIDSKIYLNSKEITVKELGKKTKLNKIRQWSTIAERLQQFCTLRVEFFTDYQNIRKYYTHPEASYGSCMRYEFDLLPVHPCIVYAHDVLDYRTDARNLVDPSVKLAVLFSGDLPLARCMVDTSTKQRAKAQGKRASELVKLLADFEGDYGLSGSHINIVPYGDKYIMPYIDGNDNVCEVTGEIGEGSLVCNNQDGTNTTQVWSEYYDEFFDANDVVYSDYLDTYIPADTLIETYEGYYVPDDFDELHRSDYEDTYFIDTDGWYFLDFMDTYVLADDVKQLCLEHIENHASLDELIEIADKV